MEAHEWYSLSVYYFEDEQSLDRILKTMFEKQEQPNLIRMKLINLRNLKVSLFKLITEKWWEKLK